MRSEFQELRAFKNSVELHIQSSTESPSFMKATTIYDDFKDKGADQPSIVGATVLGVGSRNIAITLSL